MKKIADIYYEAFNPKIWFGRSDGSQGDRFYSRVIGSSLENMDRDSLDLALLGFSSDEGVRRNKGRTGACWGPKKIREQLRNLPVHFTKGRKILDLGNIICNDGDLESSQSSLAQSVSVIRELGKIPIVLGGGHETAWGHFCGLKKDLNRGQLAIVNFDAHFDLRLCDEDNPANSGTPFYQIAEFCKSSGTPFDYSCFGIQKFSNTQELFKRAKELGTKVVTASEMQQFDEAVLRGKIKQICDKVEHVYLTVCLDVFASAFAPGVSAPNPLGISPHHVFPLLKELIRSGKVIAMDVVELSPELDQNDLTARLAAQLVNFMIHEHSLSWT